jgi:NTP pyrophosphatase (non-canonical NTP hydrolase)
MNQELLFNLQDHKILQKARETYGAHKQIGVAAEECTELAKELIKSFRYDNFEEAVIKTKENVVDEVADVYIVLDHILNLYNITLRDLIPQVDKKIKRLSYWLENSNSIEFTATHRQVPEDRKDLPYDAFGDYTLLQHESIPEKPSEEIRIIDMGKLDKYIIANGETVRKDNE